MEKLRHRLRPDLLTVALWSVLLGGTIVRFVGVDFGLPLTIKSDEGGVVDTAIDMIDRRSFEPDFFSWPNHLGAMATYLAIVFVTPLWHGMLAEQAIGEIEIGYFHLIARSVTAVFGVVGIVLAYFIGKRFHRIAGVFAAAFVAFMPEYVAESHYATPDIVLTATILAIALAAMVYVNKPTVPYLLAMSVLTSLAIMAKYPGALGTVVIAAVVIAAAIRDRAWWRIVGHGVTSFAAVGAFLFLLSPVLFTNRHVVLRRLTAESRDSHLGADGLSFTEKLVFYASNYFSGTGIILLVLSIAGVYYLVRNWRLDAIPLFIGAVFWVALSTLGLHWSRWGLPMYITPLLLAALGAYFVVTVVRSRWESKRLINVGVAVVLGFALVTQVVASIATSASFLRLDTRLIALKDFEQRGVTEDNTAYEGYTPFRARWFDTIFDDVGEWDGKLIPIDVDVEYVVVGPMQGRFGGEEFAAEQRVYQLIDEQYPLLALYQSNSAGLSLPLSNLRLMSSLASIGNTALGATGGPTIKLYGVPENVRP